VDVDGKAGIFKVVEHLFKNGHRRIAYLGEAFTLAYARDRYDGYRQGLQQFGLSEDTRLVAYNLQNEATVAAALQPMLALPAPERPTALVAGNDYLALHLLELLPGLGFTVGRDREQGQLAVTGFDDLPFASFLQPALTTLRQPIVSTCTVLLDLLVALIKNPAKPAPALTSRVELTSVGPNQVLLQPELIVRASA
jgi:LacI family transcriptional regulator